MNTWAWPATVPQQLFSIVMGGDGWVAPRVLAADAEELLREVHAPGRDLPLRRGDRRFPEGVHRSVSHAPIQSSHLDVPPPDPQGSPVVGRDRGPAANPLGRTGPDPVGDPRCPGFSR